MDLLYDVEATCIKGGVGRETKGSSAQGKGKRGEIPEGAGESISVKRFAGY